MSAGVAVIDGAAFAIDEIRLTAGRHMPGGCVLVRFTVTGPQSLHGPITIYGEDRAPIWQGKTYHADVPAGHSWQFEYELHISNVESSHQVQYL